MSLLTKRLFCFYDLARLDTLGHAHVNKKHVLVACMPKSGSTFLSTIIGNLHGFSNIALVPGYDRREQELDYLSLVYHNRSNYVSHHHVRWSAPLSKQLHQFSIKPVVMVRNLFDVCVSLRDHYRRESPIGSMAYANEEMVSWDDERLEIFLASMAIPWYLSFYIGWQECSDKVIVNYADLSSRPESTVAKVLEYAGVAVSDEQIRAAVRATAGQNTRKNKAVVGRGQDLSPAAREKILELANFYSSFDLKPIGID